LISAPRDRVRHHQPELTVAGERDSPIAFACRVWSGPAVDFGLVSRFIASGDQAAFRTPYVRDDPGAINMSLGQLSELPKASFLIACIRHAWRTHVSYDLGSPIADEVIEVVSDLLEGRPIDLVDLHPQIAALNHALRDVKARAKAGDPRAIAPTNVTYVLSVLTTWLYRALGALVEDPELTWFGYVIDTSAWLPFWLVLDGAASVGGPAERAWQEEAVRGFVIYDELEVR